MKTASRVLGIVGGALSLVIALLILLVILSATSGWEYPYTDGSAMGLSYCAKGADSADSAATGFMLLLVAPGIVCGGLGITGGIIVPKKSTAAGVMFIIAAVLSLLFLITMVCFILAAVFAFSKDRPRPPYNPYYPYAPYYPYPQYPAYPYGTPQYGAPAPPYYGCYPVPQPVQPPQPQPPRNDAAPPDDTRPPQP